MGKKTSVYLSTELAGRVETSGLPISELVRRGLDAGEPQSAEVTLTRLLDGWGERILQRLDRSAGLATQDAPADCPHRGLNPGAWCKTCQSAVPERRKR